MNTIQEIERAIQTLGPRELEELYSWPDQHRPQPIDGRIQSDLAADRLDIAIHRALEEEKAVAFSRVRNRLHGVSRHFPILATLRRDPAAHPRRCRQVSVRLLKVNPQHRSSQFKKIGNRPPPTRPCFPV